MYLAQMTLRAARINAGFSQKDAAKRLNITPKTLSFWENGDRFPTIVKVQQICELYSVHYDDLVFLPETLLKAKSKEE